MLINDRFLAMRIISVLSSVLLNELLSPGIYRLFKQKSNLVVLIPLQH